MEEVLTSTASADNDVLNSGTFDSTHRPVEDVAGKKAEKTLVAELKNLTPEDVIRANDIAAKIDVLDTASIMDYAKDTQSSISGFADSLLSETRTANVDVLGTQLLEIVSQSKKIELRQPGWKSTLMKVPLLGRLINHTDQVRRQYTSIKSNVDDIVENVNTTKNQLIERTKLLDDFYLKNNAQYKDLLVYIAAGKLKINELEANIIPMLESNNTDHDAFKSQKIYDYKESLHRFSKKIGDLEATAVATLQNGPQIRIIQNNNIILIENVQNAVNNVIPIWKKQIVMYTSLADQKAASDLEKAIKDATNEMMVRNVEMTKENSIQVAKQNERAVIDLATLEKVQTELEATLTEVSRIAAEGKKAREDASKQLALLTTRVEGKLLVGNYQTK
jgi:uncharacterized protein YaaN involved in tellurite resistance